MARNGLGASRVLIDRNVIGVMEGGEEADAYQSHFALSPTNQFKRSGFETHNVLGKTHIVFRAIALNLFG